MCITKKKVFLEQNITVLALVRSYAIQTSDSNIELVTVLGNKMFYILRVAIKCNSRALIGALAKSNNETLQQL